MLRIIHPNRWFFWTIGIIIAIGLFLLAAINFASLYFQDQAMEQGMQNPVSWKSYKAPHLGLAVRYPPFWQIEIDPLERDSITFENPQKFDEHIQLAMLDPATENSLRDILKAHQEKKITVDGESGSWFTAMDAESGMEYDVVLVRHGGRLYFITGNENYLEKFVDSVRFLD